MATERQIELVQTTWAQVAPIGPQAASMFYEKLFDLDPTLRHLFHGDMQEQGARLVGMIDVAVKSLGNLDAIVPAVQALGRRHAGYGVKVGYYSTVADALLWTLRQGLGESFTAEACEAWTVVYMLLAGTMQEAAAQAQFGPPKPPVMLRRTVSPASFRDIASETFLLSQVGVAS